MNSFLQSLGYNGWILSALLLLPLAGALVVWRLPPERAKRAALVISLAEFVLSLGLWWAYDASSSAMQFVQVFPWLPEWGISYRVGLDGISLFMVLLSTGILPLSVLGSWHYIHERESGYYALLLVLLTGMLGVFVALDMFVFYVFWEVMLIPMYFIIGIWGGSNRLYAAIKFFIYTFFGSLLMLVAILVMTWQVAQATGTISFNYEDLLAHAAVLKTSAPWLFAALRSPLPSRCRSSRSTPGCPTPTSRRRRRAA